LQVTRDALHAYDLPYGTVVTIGNYDGIHLGQRAVLERVVARARELGCRSAVVTFEPHPLQVLRPESAPRQLTTRDQKERLLAEIGIDHLLVVSFNAELARTDAGAFVRTFLHDGLGVRELYVGRNFHFGRAREGNVELLAQLGTELGFGACAVDEVRLDGETVSSSRIRQALQDGDVAGAARLLGRPYALVGVVVRGDRMGKRLGWPTVNLKADNQLVPLEGVYTSQVFFPSLAGSFDSVTNVGTRPTVYENYQRVVESHILDFASDVYGERLELSFFERLREERLFQNTMDLSAQIARDVEATREFFKHRREATRR
jgi:riboflavin kinase/FMN adenylyltransferase